MTDSHGSAIVTGASSGLGLELALLMAADGLRVVGVSRSVPKDSRWAKAADRGRAHHVEGDVSDAGTVDRAFAAASAPLTAVVNCAGAGVFGPAGHHTRADVDRALRANLIGTILFSERAATTLASGAVIINIMSTAATVAKPGQAVYCAVKWGARGYTDTLRQELKGSGIRVVGVYPGGMDTPFWTDPPPGVDPTTFMPAAEVARRVLEAVTGGGKGYVSDLVINRP